MIAVNADAARNRTTDNFMFEPMFYYVSTRFTDQTRGLSKSNQKELSF